jgi:hypothetical protein
MTTLLQKETAKQQLKPRQGSGSRLGIFMRLHLSIDNSSKQGNTHYSVFRWRHQTPLPPQFFMRFHS